MGIEPTSKAWEAFVLPLNYTRMTATLPFFYYTVGHFYKSRLIVAVRLLNFVF